MLKRKIEWTYACVQGLYWISVCCLSGYTTVYLSYRGVNDSAIAFVASLVAGVSIILQLVISQYCDKYRNISLKRVVSILYLLSISFCILFHFFPISLNLVLFLFVLSSSMHGSGYGLLNALYARYTLAGIDVEYGWPRGFGSIGYALMAFFLGIIVRYKNPDILITLYLIFAVLALISVQSMPMVNEKKQESVHSNKNYLELLRTNRKLLLFLVASVVSSASLVGVSVFLIRVIEFAGGTTAQLGIAMLIQSGLEIPVMFASSYLLKKFHSSTLLLISFTATSLKIILLSFASSMPMIYACMFISILCYGIYGFASVYYINEIVSADETVRGQTLVTLCYNNGIGAILGGILNGFLVKSDDLHYMFLFSSLLSLLAIFIMLISLRKKR